jgi:hypothetical protein
MNALVRWFETGVLHEASPLYGAPSREFDVLT